MGNILIEILVCMLSAPAFFLMYKKTIKEPEKLTRKSLITRAIISAVFLTVVFQVGKLFGF